MSAAWISWPAGLAVSALVNAGALTGLALILQPAPVPDQPSPDMQLDVAAYRLDRTQAAPAAPVPDRAAEAAAGAATLDAGAIPVTSGTARPPPSQPAAPVEPRPDAAASTTPQPAPLPASQGLSDPLPQAQPRPAPARPATPSTATVLPAPPSATNALPAATAPQTLAATAPPTSGLSPSRPAPQGLAPARAAALTADTARPDTLPIDSTRPASAPATAASTTPEPANPAQPSATPGRATAPALTPAVATPGRPSPATATAARPDSAPALAPTARPAAPGAPQSQQAPTARAEIRPLPQTAPEPLRMQAALAFAGGDGDIDPVSLAAFQSFVAPGTATAADTLRDGLQGLLASVPCSRLQLAFDPDTASLRVDGHIPEEDQRAGILAALRAEMGTDIGVSDNMAILPRPQCGALAGIGAAGLPQSTDQATNPLLLGETLHARALDFSDGELLYFDLTAPEYDAHVYVDYFDAAGNVLHLSPSDSAPLIRAAAGSTFRVGAATASDPGLKLLVGPPYGQEIAVAFAASRPLYDGLRPMVEPAGPYLDWLRSQVAAARARDPGFKGEWVYFFVTTGPAAPD